MNRDSAAFYRQTPVPTIACTTLTLGSIVLGRGWARSPVLVDCKMTIGMGDLPLDAIESITRHLSAKDVMNCSAVNHTWYHVFSNDIFWKKYYNKLLVTYLENSECLVQPPFTINRSSDSSLSLSEGKVSYQRENHLRNNWRLGRYEQRDVVFECDETISYNIKVEFHANNYIYLHTTYQTEIWDVTNQPNLIITVPFKLNELWEDNIYKAISEKLIVIQCNVVQVFNISLESKSFTFAFTFFFDKSQEFSSNITDETNIDDIFQETSFDIAEDFVRVICGSYLIGFVTDTESLKKPVMHVWDLQTGKKVKEYQCPVSWPVSTVLSSIDLKVSEAKQNVLVIFETEKGSYYNIYNLCKMEFLMGGESFVESPADIMFCGNYLYALDSFKLKLLCHMSGHDVLYPSTTLINNEDKLLNCVRALDDDRVLFACESDVSVLSLASGTIDLLFKVDYTICDFEVIHGRYIAIHDMECNVRDIWEIGKPCKKLFALNDGIGTYRTVNEVSTKIVIERANVLTVLNFW